MNYDKKVIEDIKVVIIPLGAASIYENILDAIDDAQIVLLGEATHGTHEFYTLRAEISKRLIMEKDFNMIAIEGDWPDAWQVNEFIQGKKQTKAVDALVSFDRFPTWMWRNVPILELVTWLHTYNQEQEDKVGFYGLDLYSLYRSIDTVIKILEKVDPAAAAEARHHYSCFDHFENDPQAYGYAVFTKALQACSAQVLEQLTRMLQRDWSDVAQGSMTADQKLNVEQNARVVKNAEQYYRSLFLSNENCWNLRDTHMVETVNVLMKEYQERGVKTPKMIVWAHNSHIGNAAATQMGQRGEYNIGQLLKQQLGNKVFSLGFTTYHGTVSAASDWHGSVERKNVLPALPESYEGLLHAMNIPQFFLPLAGVKHGLPEMMLERAIGVVYRPETERQSHYFYAHIAEQFDAVIHYDKTTAVEPLEKTALWLKGEVPETYPSGL